MLVLGTKVGEFEVSPGRFVWLAVHSKQQSDHARLFDVISEIERRESEECPATN